MNPDRRIVYGEISADKLQSGVIQPWDIPRPPYQPDHRVVALEQKVNSLMLHLEALQTQNYTLTNKLIELERAMQAMMEDRLGLDS